MADVNDIVKLGFADADAAHRQHLATESYAEHQALGEFYEEVRGKIDALAEILVALGQRVTPIPKTPVEQLRQGYLQLQILRDVCDGVPTAENALDEVGAVYLKAIYRLERLS